MPQQPHMFPNDVQDGIPMRRAEPTHRRNSALGASPKNKLTQTMLGKASHGGRVVLSSVWAMPVRAIAGSRDGKRVAASAALDSRCTVLRR